MGEDFLHIAGHHIIPAPEPGHGLCHGGDSQGGPGGGTPENMFILPVEWARVDVPTFTTIFITILQKKLFLHIILNFS
jgi:hypothetical protein